MNKTNTFGHFLGGILLVAGSCIGAGMLGMPVLTSLAGFRPSVAMFTVCWLFMLTTGLLLLEVNLWFDEEVSIISMAGKTLGKAGQIIGWLLYLFLFYSLMVAYVTGSGALFSDFVLEITDVSLPFWIGSLLFIALLGYLVFTGTSAVDQFNRLLMAGLVISYLLLVVLGIPHVKKSFLAHSDWPVAIYAVPAMVVMFGFHNLVPSLTTYLKKDADRLKWMFIIGSFISLLVYLLWQWVILGIIPLEGELGLRHALDQGDIATHSLRRVVGGSWIVDIAEYFAFFAITTSFLGVALSFVDFLADGLKVKKTPSGKALLCCLVLLPPFVLGLAYPKAFLTALSYAGGFGAVTLFGILPALMVWKGRYSLRIVAEKMVPGGKVVLILLILFALMVVGFEIHHELGRYVRLEEQTVK